MRLRNSWDVEEKRRVVRKSRWVTMEKRSFGGRVWRDAVRKN